MNKRNFSFLVVAMLTMMFFSCSKTENGNVDISHSRKPPMDNGA